MADVYNFFFKRCRHTSVSQNTKLPKGDFIEVVRLHGQAFH